MDQTHSWDFSVVPGDSGACDLIPSTSASSSLFPRPKPVAGRGRPRTSFDLPVSHISPLRRPIRSIPPRGRPSSLLHSVADLQGVDNLPPPDRPGLTSWSVHSIDILPMSHPYSRPKLPPSNMPSLRPSLHEGSDSPGPPDRTVAHRTSPPQTLAGFRGRGRGRAASRGRGLPQTMQLARNQCCSDSPLVQSILTDFLHVFGSFSAVLSDLRDSPNIRMHMNRLLDAFAPSTVFRYMSTLLQLHSWSLNLEMPMQEWTEVQMADLLLSAASSDPSVSPGMAIKSFSWALKQFGISLFPAVQSALVQSFNKRKLVADRKEALPYPLQTIMQWERRMLQNSASQTEVVVLGGLLVMTWSGMRFGDLQRLRMDSLCFDGKTLRGISFRTKTSTSGCPFGVHCCGLLSWGSHTWVHRFLAVLDGIYEHSQRSEIDYLIPGMDDGGVRLPLQPMHYSEALGYCRKYLQIPWRSQSQYSVPHTLSYTVHGLKSTLLSWASQAMIAPELRLLQGHHADPLKATRLYSRDDVNGALHLQWQLIVKIQSGWRPFTPQGRGGQHPIPEQAFALEKFDKVAKQHDWQFFNFLEHPVELGQLEPLSDGSSSPTLSSDSDGSQACPEPMRAAPAASEEAEVGLHRGTWHILLERPGFSGSSEDLIRTACGRKFSANTIQAQETLDFSPPQTLCYHPGCKKGWASIGAL